MKIERGVQCCCVRRVLVIRYVLGRSVYASTLKGRRTSAGSMSLYPRPNLLT